MYSITIEVFTEAIVTNILEIDRRYVCERFSARKISSEIVIYLLVEGYISVKYHPFFNGDIPVEFRYSLLSTSHSPNGRKGIDFFLMSINHLRILTKLT